jgi:hypothetical protein
VQPAVAYRPTRGNLHGDTNGTFSCTDRPDPRRAARPAPEGIGPEGGVEGRRQPAPARGQDVRHGLPKALPAHPRLLRDGHDPPGRPGTLYLTQRDQAGRAGERARRSPRPLALRRWDHGARLCPRRHARPGPVRQRARDQRPLRLQPPLPGVGRLFDHRRGQGLELDREKTSLRRRREQRGRIPHLWGSDAGDGFRHRRAAGLRAARRRVGAGAEVGRPTRSTRN